MAENERFRSSMSGFKKSDVNNYIERLLREFEDKLKEKDSEILNLKNQNKEIRAKYEDLASKADQINEDRSKIASVLLKAQEKAELMINEAKSRADEEKKTLEAAIEQEKEKFVDIKEELKKLKNGVIDTLKKYDVQLTEMIKEEPKQS